MKLFGTCINILLSSLLMCSCSSGSHSASSGIEETNHPDSTKKSTEQVHISKNADSSSLDTNFRVKIPTHSLVLTDEQFQNIKSLDATMANSDQLDFSRKYLERFSTSKEINNAMVTGKWEEARSDFQTDVVLMLNFWPSMGPDRFVMTNFISGDSGDTSPTRWRVAGKYQLSKERLRLEFERIDGDLPEWVESKVDKTQNAMGDLEMTLEVKKLPDIYIIGIKVDKLVLYVDDL